MVATDKLLKAMISDIKYHPERMNATIERIEEVLENTLEKNFAEKLLKNDVFTAENKRAPLKIKHAKKICNLIANSVNYDQLIKIREMLQDSEISSSEAIDLHKKYKIPVSHLERDIIPVRGEGAWIVSNKGKLYLDMDSNYSATNLGISNYEIGLGLFNQASQLISMKEDRVHIPRTRFLKTIMDMMPEGLNHFYWQNSGGEAVDKSIKIAKAYTKNRGVVALKDGFHGRTHGAVAVTYNIKYREPFGLENEDWVYFADIDNIEYIEKLFLEEKVRSIILELVQGEEAGIRPLNMDFVKNIRKLCDKFGGVMICDEVQTGFGRVARKQGQWFASHTYGITPDILVIGKSFGGGYPVTAVVTKKVISDAMENGYDGSTFGGNPMAMVSAFIATKQMRENNITKNVVERSKQIFNGLNKIREKFDLVSDVHGMGLMIAMVLPSEDDVKNFQKLLASNGVKSSLSTKNVVRFLPPLVINEAEANFLLEAIGKSLEKMQ